MYTSFYDSLFIFFLSTIRFKKTIQEINGTDAEAGISKVKVSFRDFIKVISAYKNIFK